MSRICKLIAVACVLSVSSIAQADGREFSTFELGIFGGAFFIPDGHELFDSDNSEFKPLQESNFELGLRLAYLPIDYVGIEFEAASVTSELADDSASARIFIPRAHVLVQYPWLITPFLVGGVGGEVLRSAEEALGDDTDFVGHWGVGAKIGLSDRVYMRFDGRHIIAPGLLDDRENHWELLGGFTIGLDSVARDRDGDGVDDRADECPDEAGSEPNGCNPGDADGDGVNDRADACPNEAGLAQFQGCPDPDPDGDGVARENDSCPDVAGEAAFDGCPNPDRDGDGVANDDDSCPDVAGVAPTGCPATDADGDGVEDEDDACPNEAGELENGCPNLDKDNDGVPVPTDACPDEPETVNGYEDNDGCPDTVPEEIKQFTGTIKGITFRTGSAVIAVESYPLLDRAVSTLQEYPELRLRIVGHTDSTGSASGNQRISEQRANAVRDYFVKKGVAAERLEALGKGEESPVASNETADGRAQNRRIDFELIQ
ncbi:MAG: OmpA family protein [Myxococcota bacterium]